MLIKGSMPNFFCVITCKEITPCKIHHLVHLSLILSPLELTSISSAKKRLKEVLHQAIIPLCLVILIFLIKFLILFKFSLINCLIPIIIGLDPSKYLLLSSMHINLLTSSRIDGNIKSLIYIHFMEKEKAYSLYEYIYIYIVYTLILTQEYIL